MDHGYKTCPSCGERMKYVRFDGFRDDLKTKKRVPWILEGHECEECGRFIDE